MYLMGSVGLPDRSARTLAGRKSHLKFKFQPNPWKMQNKYHIQIKAWAGLSLGPSIRQVDCWWGRFCLAVMVWPSRGKFSGWGSSCCKVSHEWLDTLWEDNVANNGNNSPSPKTTWLLLIIIKQQPPMRGVTAQFKVFPIKIRSLVQKVLSAWEIHLH